MGRIEPWSHRRIVAEGWLRLAIRSPSWAQGRAALLRFAPWFREHGRGACMIDLTVCGRFGTVAFSEPADCILFRLTFDDVPLEFVPQPRL